MKHEKTFAAIEKLKDVELELHRLKNALEMANRALDAQPAQEPVAWGVFEGNLHDLFLTQAEAQEMAALKGSHAKVRPLYTAPPKVQASCCAECGRKESDGWWLYCVGCMDKVTT
jgi:hypothetical protein